MARSGKMGPIYEAHEVRRLTKLARKYTGKNGRLPTIPECKEIARAYNRGARAKRTAEGIRARLLRLGRSNSRRGVDSAMAGVVWELRANVARAEAALAEAKRKLANVEGLRAEIRAALNG